MMQSILCKRFTVGINAMPCNVFKDLRRRSFYLGEHFSRGSLVEIELTSPVPLAGRKYVASSQSPSFPKYLAGPREDYPLLVKAKNSQGAGLLEWAKRARGAIDEAYRRFEKEGTAVAILFRGLPIKNMNDYSLWVNALGFMPFKYTGGVTQRSDIEFNVAEGALDPKECIIEPHNEMAYALDYPKIFTIFCLQKATKGGGETAICDVRQILANLDPNFVGKCRTKQIRYTHFLHDKNNPDVSYKSWQEQFFTDDKAEVEAVLKESDCTFEWRGNSLYYWVKRPAFITDPRNGKLLWFNSLASLHHSYFTESPHLEGKQLPEDEYVTNSMYGDGERFTQDELDHLRSTVWKNAVGFEWQNGDVLFLDQLIVQHSRLSYEGKRQVGVSLLTY